MSSRKPSVTFKAAGVSNVSGIEIENVTNQGSGIHFKGWASQAPKHPHQNTRTVKNNEEEALPTQ